MNVTKYHTCHAKRSNDLSETAKKGHLCGISHRHGHTGIARTVADGCGRLRTVANGCGRLRTAANGCDHKRNVERTHPQPPDPQNETGILTRYSGKNNNNSKFDLYEYKLNLYFLCFLYIIIYFFPYYLFFFKLFIFDTKITILLWEKKI